MSYGDHIDYNTGQKCDCSLAISGGHYRGRRISLRLSHSCPTCVDGWVFPMPHGVEPSDCPAFYDMCRCDSTPCPDCIDGYERWHRR